MNRKIKAVTTMISLILIISLGLFSSSASAIEYVLLSLGRVDATAKYEFYSGYDDKSEDYYNMVIDNDFRLMKISGRTCNPDYKVGRYLIRYTSDKAHILEKDFEIAKDGTYSLFLGINGLSNGEYIVTAVFNLTKEGLDASSAYQIRGIPFVVSDHYACFFPHGMVIYQNNQLRAEENYAPRNYLDKTGAEYKETNYGLSKPQVKYLQNISDWLTKDVKTNREKMLKIHNWVASNLYYDDYSHKYGGSITNPYSLARSICDGYSTKTVCNGYSSLVTILARCAKIPCRQVKGHAILLPKQSWESEGKTLSKVDHFWNEAYVDGRWMTIDATRDTSNKYTVDGEWKWYNFIRYDYFDPSDDSLAATHLTIGYKKPIIPPEPTTAKQTEPKDTESKKSENKKSESKKSDDFAKSTEKAETTKKEAETTTAVTTQVATENTTEVATQTTQVQSNIAQAAMNAVQPTAETTTLQLSSSGDTLTVAPPSDEDIDDDMLSSTPVLESSVSGKDNKSSIKPEMFIVIGAVVVVTLASSLSIVFIKKKK